MTARPDLFERRRNGRLLGELIATEGGLLRAQARKHAQLEVDAEEALQSAYALFLEKYRPPAEPLPWLMTTVKREAWRIAKRASRRYELAITAAPRIDGAGTVDLSDAFPDSDREPYEAAEAGEAFRHQRAALKSLKPDQRSALLLFGLGYSYREIAALRGWTLTKVNRCISEGRARLRSILRSPSG